MMNTHRVALALRELADALEQAPAPRHVVTIAVAPAGAEPQPFIDPEMAGAARILATVYLSRALRRYSPQETKYA